MVAIVSGAGLGLQRTSAFTLGSAGQLGSASLGRAAQGITVNAATGNLVIQTQDEFLTGRGADAAFTSSYNSLGAYTGNYLNLDGSADADGWLLSTQRRIRLVGTANAAGSSAKMTDWDGSIVTFTYNTSTGRYGSSEQPYNDDILTWSGNIFTYTEGKSRTVQTFASNIGGRLVSMYDADRDLNGLPVNMVTFTYDTNTTSGKLTRVTTANSTTGQNGYVDYGYDGSGRLQTLTTRYFDGTANQTISRVTYGYDAYNRLTSVVTDLKLLNSGQPAATYRIDYTYKPYVANDPSSRLVTGITQSDGTSLTIAYDASGRVTKLTQAMDTGVSQTTDFSYGLDPGDATKTLTTITVNSATLNYVYKMTADSLGRLTKLEEPAPVLGGNATIKTFAYDAYGNVTEALTFDNPANIANSALAIEVSRSLYDAASNLLARVNGDRSISFYTYGASNQLLSETRFADQDRNTSNDFDGDGFVTQTEYTAFLAGTYPASGAMVTRYVYDDAANNGINDDGTVYTGSNAADVAENHLRFTVSAEGRVTEYRHDGFGQLIATISYAGSTYTGTSWTEAALGAWVAGVDKTQTQRSDYIYDFRGNVAMVTTYAKTDAAGNGLLIGDFSRTIFIYDQAGRLLSRRSIGGQSSVSGTDIAAWTAQNATFTAAGTLDGGPAMQLGVQTAGTEAQARNGFAVTAGQTVSYTISLQGNGDSTSAWLAMVGLSTGWGADSASSIRILSGPGTASRLVGGLWSITGLSATEVTRIEVVRTFTANENAEARVYADTPQGSRTGRSILVGRPVITKVPTSETFVYDGLGRMISATDLYGVTTSIAINDGTRTTTITTPGEATRTQVYAIGGGLASEAVSAAGTATATTNYSYDALGRLRKATDASGLSTYYTYDRQSRLTATIDADGSISEYKYDGADRIIASVSYATAVSAASLTALGTVTANTEVTTIRPAASTSDRWSWTIYDKSGKMIETIDAAGAVVKFEYDGAGRLIASTRFATQLDAAALSAFKSTLPMAAVWPAADAANDRVARNFYGNDGLLAGTLDEEGYLVEIRYDKAGRKVETVGYSVAATSALWANGTFAQLRASIAASQTYDIHNFWIYDGRGRVMAVIDGEGQVTRYHYTARGDLDQEVRGNKLTAAEFSAITTEPHAASALPLLANLDAKLLAGQVLETTTFTRNAAGQVLTQLRALSGGTETTTFVYDTRGRLLTQTVTDVLGTNTETRTASFRYDAKGRLIGQLSGVGSAALAALGANPSQAAIDGIYANYGTRYVYDIADRLVQKIGPNGIDGTGVSTLYYYDSDGQLRFEIVEDKYWDTSLPVPAWVTKGGAITEYRYSVLEDRTDMVVYQVWLPPLTLANLIGGLVGSAITTPVAGIASVGSDSGWHWDYDVRALVSQELDPNGRTNTNSYNAFGELTQVSSTDLATRQIGYTNRGLVWYDYAIANMGDPTSVIRAKYYYDAFGRKIAQTENFTDLRAQYFGYDRANRMTAAIDALGKSESWEYDARSNVIAHTDRMNNRSTISYDLFNRTVTTTSAELISTSVQKNAWGQAISITDARGIVTRFEYDKDGNLTKTTEDYGPAATVNPITGANYLNRITTQSFDQADHLTEVTDANGTKTQYRYDALGRVLTEVRDFGAGKLNLTTRYEYDAKGQRTKVTDASGVVTTYAFNRGGQVLTLVQDSGAGKLNLTTTYEYARTDGKLTKQTEAFGTAQQRITTYAYDAYGRLTQKVEDQGGLNLTTQYYYDVNNNLVAEIELPGTAQERKTRFVYDLNNRLVLTIDAEGGVVQNFYDAEDRLVAIRQFAGLLGSPQLAALADPAVPAQWNEITTAINGDLTLTRKVRDYALNTTTVTGTATLLASTSDRKTRTLYDKDGRATFAIDAEGYAARNVLDANGNVLQSIRYAVKPSVDDTSTAASLTAWLATNPQIAASTSYLYDALGRVTRVTDPENMVTVIAYHAQGQYIDTIRASGTADEVTTRTTFDALGRTIDEIRAYGTSEAVTTRYAYDTLGQVTDVTVAQGTTDAVTTRRTYDALGRVLSEVRDYGGINATSQFTYDALGRLVKTIDPRGYASFAFYDNLDRTTWQVDAEGYVTKYEYLTGAGTKVTRYVNMASNAALVSPTVLPSVSADTSRDRVTFAYTDKLDRVVLQVDSLGNMVKTEYGFGGEISKVTRFANPVSNFASLALTSTPTVVIDTLKDASSTFLYDKNGRVIQSTDAELKSEYYGYDALGQRISFTNKLGGITGYTYYKTGLLKTETVQGQKSYDANGNALLDDGVAATTLVTSYTYDLRGNLKTKVIAANLGANALTTSYGYDKLDRLTSQTDPAFFNPDATTTTLTPITQWEYDRRGNVRLQTAPDGGKTLTFFDALNRKSAEVSPVGTFSEWLYDANGNLTNQKIWSASAAIPTAVSNPRPTGSGTPRETQLSYDKNGRLTQSLVMNVRTGVFNGTAYVTSAPQNLQSNNEYDGLGNLVKEIDANRNAIHHWYDRNGRETAKLDQEQFLTTWLRDADGNVTSETRFANKYVGSITAAAPSVTADAVNDRTTTFTYDRMGRRLTEVRKAMLVATVTGNTVTTASQDVTVGYSYNALGEVLSKTEATGDRTDYQYDLQGRLIRQLDAVQADYNLSGTASVRHVTYFMYDGANNLVFATERAEAGTAVSNAAITPEAMGALASGYVTGDDRTTKYLYTGGKLTGMTDAMNFTRSYTYDVAGRKVAEYYTRTKSDAATVTEGNFTGYDLAGRATSQWQATRSGSTWTDLWPQTVLTYNAYGEVTTRAIKASAADTNPLVQEQMVYDNAGRVVKTNAGDGSWKVMVYDANGNATLSFSAITADMSAVGYTIDTALTAFGAVDTSANQTMAATISLYDKRNMATATREPQRQIDATATRYTITRARTYTAFGEVASETDARGNTTSYLYNTMGKATRSIAPTVSITNEDGSSQYVRPTSDYYYDQSGRLIANRDANGSYATGGGSTTGTIKAADTGNLNTRTLLAGTGYGGSEAKVLKEFRPDTSAWESQYDAFGQERVKIDGLNSAMKATSQAYVTTQYQYDKGGRVIQIIHMPTAVGVLNEYFSYDGLGQKTKHWTSHYGSGEVATTDYDSLNRVVRTRAFGGDVTTASYAWNNALTTNGMGISGVWAATTTMANGLTKVEKKDSFGHLTSQTNLGGATTNFNYDRAGQITSYVNGTSSWNFVWFNNGKRYQVSQSNTAQGGLTTFGYDLAGNIVSEVMGSYKNLAATYDAAGRLTSWTSVVTSTSSTTTVEYDANGNVRAKIQGVNADWFRYDSLNRLVTDKGLFTETVNSTAGRDPGSIGILWGKGVNYTYDLNGNRKQALRPPRPNVTNGTHVGETITYTYDNENHLTQVYTVTTTGNPRDGWGQYIYTNTYGYDLLGRLTSGTEGASPTGSARNFTQVWNQKNQLATVTSSNPAVANSTSTTNYNYNSNLGQYLLGQVGTTTTVQGSSTQTQTNEYDWYDGAVIKKTTVTGTGAQTPGVTTYVNDAFGLLISASITGAQNYSNYYVYDAASQGIRKDVGGAYAYTEVITRMGGVELVAPNGTTVEAPSSTSLGTYKVRSGDTLTSIAAALWGDSNLWYKLAEANGLTSQSNLVDGQSLTIPGGVYRTRQAADTFVPYDAGKFVGDTQPTAVYPKPKSNNCGVFGMILLAAIAIAVAVFLPQLVPALAPAAFGGGVGGAVISGAIGAAAGSIVSQGVGLATGIQDKFSFKDVAFAAIGGAVSGGLSKLIPAGSIGGSKILTAGIKGVVGSVVTQGITVATGLQSKFNWLSVAVAGVAASASQAFGKLAFGSEFGSSQPHTAQDWIKIGIAGMAGDIASSGAKSLIDGSNFGDNLLSALPQTIASTIGAAIGSTIASNLHSARVNGIIRDVGLDPEDDNSTGARLYVEDALSRGAKSKTIRNNLVSVLYPTSEDIPVFANSPSVAAGSGAANPNAQAQAPNGATAQPATATPTATSSAPSATTAAGAAQGTNSAATANQTATPTTTAIRLNKTGVPSGISRLYIYPDKSINIVPQNGQIIAPANADQDVAQKAVIAMGGVIVYNANNIPSAIVGLRLNESQFHSFVASGYMKALSVDPRDPHTIHTPYRSKGGSGQISKENEDKAKANLPNAVVQASPAVVGFVSNISGDLRASVVTGSNQADFEKHVTIFEEPGKAIYISQIQIVGEWGGARAGLGLPVPAGVNRIVVHTHPVESDAPPSNGDVLGVSMGVPMFVVSIGGNRMSGTSQDKIVTEVRFDGTEYQSRELRTSGKHTSWRKWKF